MPIINQDWKSSSRYNKMRFGNITMYSDKSEIIPWIFHFAAIDVDTDFNLYIFIWKRNRLKCFQPAEE